jgi:23S rRNA pseudouridine1911/1915/1917 synthase
VYEDNDFVAFDKPSGLVVNRSHTTKDPTLQDYIEEKYVDVFSVKDGDEVFSERGGIVHRLDKDTSGVIVVAKNPQSFYALQRQFKRRETKKEYIAVVIGIVKDTDIEINAPLGRNPKHPMKFAIVNGGRESLTLATKLSELEFEGVVYTLMRVFPRTGRTHQIRVHLAALRNPVAADPLYCTTKQYEQSSQVYPRMMLHAHRLQIKHPKSNELIQLEVSVPSEFPHLSY